MKKKWIILIIILTLLGVTFVYLFTGIYSADDKALNYLKSSDTVTVNELENGYFFDGPGKDTAIIFYGGAKVEYTAYAKLLFQISELGYDTFLLKMPFHIAFFGVNAADSVIKNYSYDSIYLSGHSLGGVVASSYAIKHSDTVKGIIALASYPTSKIPDNLKYISIYGSEDKVLNKEKYEEAKKYLPSNSKEFIIDGGNHANFANYGTQKKDGNSLITREEQQSRVLEILSQERNEL